MEEEHPGVVVESVTGVPDGYDPLGTENVGAAAATDCRSTVTV
jgi:hypothetical protein